MPRTPTYRRIADDIRGKITSGEWPPGHKLPTFAELMAQYEASSTVVRGAMITLDSEGLIEGHQGKGVYVKQRPS